MKHKKDYPAAVKLLFWLPAACIAAAIFFGCIVALLFKPKPKG